MPAQLSQRFHGSEPPRGLEDVPSSPLFQGRFGRMFRNLPPFDPEKDLLQKLAAVMVEPKAPPRSDGNGADPLDNRDIPAGFTYLGQFIDHDITFDPNSNLQRRNDPDALVDFRTPRFDLDSVYGRGPNDEPFLYHPDGIRLRIGKNGAGEDDLPRTSPGEGLPRRALIGDPRNDENVIVSQIQLAVLKFHNAVVDRLEQGGGSADLFDRARAEVRWHYQWIVIHDFLATIAGSAIIDDILSSESYDVLSAGAPVVVTTPHVRRKFFNWQNSPYMPVEFSVAAYRFGHSMVRPEYELNKVVKDKPIFSPDPNAGEFDDLRGFRERPPQWVIEWHRFFSFPDQDVSELQHSRLLDTKLAPGLSTLPPGVVATDDPHKALGERNLLRGKALGLPTGQDVAHAMGLPDDLILRGDSIGLSGDIAPFADRTPLWFYVLKEAEVLNEGKHLGPVGGRIVAEVLIGLLEGDPKSYLSVRPEWKPTLPAAQSGNFTMSDLLLLAGVTV